MTLVKISLYCILKKTMQIMSYLTKSKKAKQYTLLFTFYVKGEMYEGKQYPLEKNLTYFLYEFTKIFLPLEISLFFKTTKMYIFPTCFTKRNYEVTFSIGFSKPNM